MRVGIISFQLRRAWMGKKWRYALLLFMAVLAVAFIQTCLGFWGHDVAELPSAAFAWVGNHGAMQTPIFGLFVYFLMVPCSSAVFADRLFLDVRQRQANAIAVRAPQTEYVVSAAVTAFFSAFVLVFLALLVSQLLAWVAFPAAVSQDAFVDSFNTPASYEMTHSPGAKYYLLADLMEGNRALFNVLVAAYEALWSGILALVSLAISLYTKRSRIAVLGIPALALLVLSSFLPSKVNVMATYLGLSFMWGQDATLLGLIGLPLLFLAATSVAIAVALATRRDVLL